MNDNQIRCTLTKADLEQHNITIRDLSYGSDQARALFREMMEQAGRQFGFEAEDMPLMIEAVPLNGESIVFVITKVEDPEELDTRFAKFAPGLRDEAAREAFDNGGDDRGSASAPPPAKKADQLLSLFDQRVNRLGKLGSRERLAMEIPSLNISWTCSFEGLTPLFQAAKRLAPIFEGGSCLYKSGKNYLLRLYKEETPIDLFNRVCNTASEYGKPLDLSLAGEAWLEEHCRVLIDSDAVAHLAMVGAD